MEINKETAMRLWTKTFGKRITIYDFTGRKIVKSAYNNHDSEFGWNIDYVLPQSKGGETAEYNLVFCHLKTIDDKTGKFPCFNANGINFQIIKGKDHYEIKDAKETKEQPVNFYDSADGIKKIRNLKKIQKEEAFVASILIILKNVENTAVIDFIKEIFDEENISYSMKSINSEAITEVRVTNYNVPLKEDIANLLDKCILLRTYLATFFTLDNCIDSFDIIYQVNYYKTKQEMYLDDKTINFDDYNLYTTNSLLINDLVIINTEAKDEIEPRGNNTYTRYNVYFRKLVNDLIACEFEK